jgi:hypothetical protein
MDENDKQKVRDEIVYWKQVLKDTLAINDKTHQAAEGGSELILIGSEILLENPEMTNRLMDVLEKVQTPIGESQEILLGLIQLTEGRLKMILSQVKDPGDED